MKPKKCKDCKLEFTPFKFAQPRCMSCALLLAKSKREAKVNRDRIALQREEKQRHKIAKDKIKPLSKWKSEAQAVFNKYIRIRDKSLPCISCEITQSAQWDSGHFFTRAARSWLSFNEDNAHKQCSPCNQHKSGNLIAYRIGLIKKIGIERVEALENNHDNKRKLTVDDYKQIIAEYKLKIKQLGE